MTPAALVLNNESRSSKRICVMDASGPLGSTIIQRLLQRGYTVNAAAVRHCTPGSELHGDQVKCLDGGLLTSCNEKKNKRLTVFHTDPLDYHSILEALKGCCGLFYCFEPPSDHPTYDELMAELEVRAAHNVLEACAQTNTIDKVVFTSSATAVICRDGLGTLQDFDERNWSDVNFCKKYKLWHGLSKTLAEKAAWALAMDRGLNMVSVNGGLLLPNSSPPDGNQLMTIDIPYLKGAAQMYEDGVFVTTDLEFLVDAHVCVYEDVSSYGRYMCFNQVINSNIAALKLARVLFPSSPSPQSLEEDKRVYQQRISNKKLNKLMVGFQRGGLSSSKLIEKEEVYSHQP